MILLLGASGYIGEAFARELQRRKTDFHAAVAQAGGLHALRRAAGISARRKSRSLSSTPPATPASRTWTPANWTRPTRWLGNTLLPQTIAHACAAAGIPWGHVSSGCIFSGAKVDGERADARGKGLDPAGSARAGREIAGAIHGFTETDTPNFSFRDPPCSFYSGTKALGEEAIAGIGQSYIWRLRIPFDEFDNPRNYLSKVQRYAKVYDNVNSISHRGDFAQACLDLWERRAPFGIYNVTNPGFVTTRQVVELIEKILKPARKFEFWANDEEFYQLAAKTPRSNCVHGRFQTAGRRRENPPGGGSAGRFAEKLETGK